MSWLALVTCAAPVAGLVLQAAPSRPAVIPHTNLPMPADYEDYTRGHQPIRLFPGTPPGLREASRPAGPGLPSFDPFLPQLSKEVFVDASPLDYIGHLCAPGGDAAGHYFYNVWHPEIVPFPVIRSSPNYQDAAVVIAPGGGGIHLAWEPEGIANAHKFNAMGISAFVLKYRVPDFAGHTQLMDAQRAISLVRSQRFARVGFMGSSAGGALGLRLADAQHRAYPPIDDVDDATPRPWKPDFLVLLYPAIPQLQHVAELPATFMAFSDDDPCCSVLASRAFVGSAEKHMRQPLVVKEYAGGKHGWGSCEYYPQLQHLPNCQWHAALNQSLPKLMGGQ